MGVTTGRPGPDARQDVGPEVQGDHQPVRPQRRRGRPARVVVRGHGEREHPGPYWALLTHPTANKDLIGEAFSDVHMLSHLVGAANRADIRRLQELEREGRTGRQAGAPAAAPDRDPRREGTPSAEAPRRPGSAREWTCGQSRNGGHGREPSARALSPDATGAAVIETLEQRLACATDHESPSTRRDLRRGRPASLAAPGTHPLLLKGAPRTGWRQRSFWSADGQRSCRRSPRLLPHAGGTLLHHDGGREMSLSLLPGMVGRADRSSLRWTASAMQPPQPRADWFATKAKL